jgi:DNA-binding winged helix-turn-helix (wHTH) protein/Tfp pilus assembly protein PilF
MPVYRFDAFELDVARGELRHGGVPVKLPPQPFTALQLLVSRAGALVTRDEMRTALWGDDNFVDFNAGLNFCMAQVRSALNDPASASRLVVAVPRRGYRLAVPVTVDEGRRPRATSLVAAAAASLLLVGVVAAWLLMPAAKPRVLSRSIEALQKYERASLGLGDAAPNDLVDRVGRFSVALEADAAWPEAWSGLAEAKLIIGNYRAEAPQVAYASAKAAAAKALALDERVAAAHTAFGAAALYLEWDWKTANRHLRRGVALAPASPRARYWYSRFLSARGEHAVAIEQAQQAVALAPTSPSVRTQLGMAFFYAGRFKEARAACSEAAALMPEFLPARFCVSATDLESTPAPPEFWKARLERLEGTASEDELSDRALLIAATLVHAGNAPRALDVLERAANRRIDVLLFARVHPALRRLEGDPRYRNILVRLGVEH